MSNNVPFPYWFKLLSLGVESEMPLPLRRKIYIINGACLWLFTLGPVFIILNALGQQYALMKVNIATSLLGLSCVALTWRRFHQTAAILLVTGAIGLFAYSGLIFNNGMEYTLLLCIVSAIFLFEESRLRIFFAITSALVLLSIRYLHFTGQWTAPFPPGRYITNFVIFILSYYWIFEIFRVATRNHQQQIEQKNHDLAESRRQLNNEHIALTRLAEELRTANKTKEKLFSLVAHDLRSPVGNLQNILSLLESVDLDQNEFLKLIPVLKAEIDHTYSSLETLLTWSASQLDMLRPEFTRVDVHNLVEDCHALMKEGAARKKLSLSNRVPRNVVVRADRNQIAAVIRNLLSNAIKFTPRDGQIIVTAAPQASEQWRISVSDTGIGIPPDRLAHLLVNANSTPGTEDERGLGLGLTICREFLEMHNTCLQVESSPGDGTTFFFDLPTATEEPLASLPLHQEPATS